MSILQRQHHRLNTFKILQKYWNFVSYNTRFRRKEGRSAWCTIPWLEIKLSHDQANSPSPVLDCYPKNRLHNSHSSVWVVSQLTTTRKCQPFVHLTCLWCAPSRSMVIQWQQRWTGSKPSLFGPKSPVVPTQPKTNTATCSLSSKSL